MSDLLKFSIPGKPEYVQMVRLAIASIAGKANFDVDAVEDVKAAVSEGCKIVFCHGLEGFSNYYEIVCEIEEEKITILISDSCQGRNPEKRDMPCVKCPADGELAIAVMASLMDDVLVSEDAEGNKNIRMVKNK